VIGLTVPVGKFILIIQVKLANDGPFEVGIARRQLDLPHSDN
jgi:hypothetical protein